MRVALAVLSVAAFSLVPSARADGPPGQAPQASQPPPPQAPELESPKVSLLIGSSLGWQYRRDFGAATRTSFSPELFAGAYLPTPRARLFLRPAVRLGYSGLDQAEQPETIQIEERDFFGSVELGVVYDGPVVPSFAIGAGGILRSISQDVSPPLESSEDLISRTQTFARVFAQLGLGLPLWRGRLLLEPSLRYAVVFGDDRIAWRGGVDLSYQL